MTHDFSRPRAPNRILIESLLDGHDPTHATRSVVSREASIRGTPRFAGRVYDGGSMPLGPDRIYLVHPILVSGPDTEGDPASIEVDDSRSIPVVVLGSRQVAVGDALLVQSVGGRWVAESGILLPSCNPQCSACPGDRYSVIGSVSDAINGTQPMVYDYAREAWFSPWLPFTTPYALYSSPGQEPCHQGTGTSYYFYRLANSGLPGDPLLARIHLPGQSCHLPNGQPTNTFYNYPGASYPALLGKPSASNIPGFTVSSVGLPGSCAPLTYDATWSSPTIDAQMPLTSATFSIPKYMPRGFGYACALPCPIPRKNLTVSWVNTSGNGSSTLVWNSDTDEWTMACTNRLAIRLSISLAGTIGFTATFWTGAGCTGTPQHFSYPTAIGQSSFTCDPFDLVFTILVPSSALYVAGYRSFVITE